MYHHQLLFHQRRLVGSTRVVRYLSRQLHQRVAVREVALSRLKSNCITIRTTATATATTRTTATTTVTTTTSSRAPQTASTSSTRAIAARRLLSSERKVTSKQPQIPTAGGSILPLNFVMSPAVQFALPLFGHTSYIILASGFLMTDMLYLRVVLAGGYAGLVAFHLLHPRPLRIPLRWSALFIFVNAGAACLLLADRYAPQFSVDDEALYQSHFQTALTRGQFHQLLQLGTRQEDVPDGEVLAVEGRTCEFVYFIEKGRAKIYHHQAFAATINQGGFVNDVAFQQGKDEGAYGTVVTSGDCSLISWDQATLRNHMSGRPEMDRNMKYLMSEHLVKSLLRQREAAYDRQQWWGDDYSAATGIQKRPTADLKFGFRRSPSESKIAWDLRHIDDKNTGAEEVVPTASSETRSEEAA